MTANGRKIRNAVRTNYCNYPVKGGRINPVGTSTGGAVYPTTIGNMQHRTQYPRPLIGIGTNGVGVATNLVLFLNDGRQDGWSINFPDTDSAQIMIDEGCNEVGEFDGGGSAAMWAAFGPDSVYNYAKSGTAHGNYVNRPSGGSPRQERLLPDRAGQGLHLPCGGGGARGLLPRIVRQPGLRIAVGKRERGGAHLPCGGRRNQSLLPHPHPPGDTLARRQGIAQATRKPQKPAASRAFAPSPFL